MLPSLTQTPGKYIPLASEYTGKVAIYLDLDEDQGPKTSKIYWTLQNLRYMWPALLTWVGVYVQVHTEGGVSGVMRAQKRAAVQHILCSSWPQLLAANAVKQVIDDLHVPAAWVAEARAWWAATSWDTHTEVISLLEAGHSFTAQQRLFEQLAPEALHNGRVSDLQDIVHMCQPSLTAPVATLAVRPLPPSSGYLTRPSHPS